MAGSSDNPSADSFSLELSMPEAVSFVFLLTDDFACLALSKDLEYLEVTRDSSLEFAKDEGTKTVFAILGLLLSVLLVPAEAFLRPDLLGKMEERHILFCWSRKFGRHLSLGYKGPVSMRCKWKIGVRFKKQKDIRLVFPCICKSFGIYRDLTSTPLHPLLSWAEYLLPH